MNELLDRYGCECETKVKIRLESNSSAQKGDIVLTINKEKYPQTVCYEGQRYVVCGIIET